MISVEGLRLRFEAKVREICERVAKGRAARHIPRNSGGGGIYLSRYYLWPAQGPTNSEATAAVHREDKSWGLVLHHIQRSDSDPELHNHPWDWAVALILVGGYREERKIPSMFPGPLSVLGLHFFPGDINIILADTFHRIELLDEQTGAWTLFLHGKRIQDWGFWDRYTGAFTHWKEFVMRERPAPAHSAMNGLGAGQVARWGRDGQVVTWNGDEEAFEQEH
jgi:hypothetical protein